MNFATIFSLILKIVPFVMALIPVVEKITNADGTALTGAQKKQNVVEAVKGTAGALIGGMQAVSAGPQLDLWNNIEKPINTLIDAGVAVYNATGWPDPADPTGVSKQGN